jgi:hypothetical protein
LFALATRAPIRAQMQAAGYRFEDHAEGLALVQAVHECRDKSGVCAGQLRAEQAIAELHQWVNAQFRRYRVAMQRLHPEAVALFPDTDSRYPMQSVLAVMHLTEDLLSGERSRDQALLETLAQRGLGAAEIERLSRLVTEAQSIEAIVEPDANADTREAELVALYEWYRDWSETARRVVTRKDYRVMLGIGGKRDLVEG